jgi:hypothetical protein
VSLYTTLTPAILPLYGHTTPTVPHVTPTTYMTTYTLNYNALTAILYLHVDSTISNGLIIPYRFRLN